MQIGAFLEITSAVKKTMEKNAVAPTAKGWEKIIAKGGTKAIYDASNKHIFDPKSLERVQSTMNRAYELQQKVLAESAPESGYINAAGMSAAKMAQASASAKLNIDNA